MWPKEAKLHAQTENPTERHFKWGFLDSHRLTHDWPSNARRCAQGCRRPAYLQSKYPRPGNPSECQLEQCFHQAHVLFVPCRQIESVLRGRGLAKLTVAWARCRDSKQPRRRSIARHTPALDLKVGGVNKWHVSCSELCAAKLWTGGGRTFKDDV